MESASISRASLLASQLQWGHGSDAVESMEGLRSSPRPDRFNGATAVMPWNRKQDWQYRDGRESFNGATAVMPWNLHLLVGISRGASDCFNGATAVMPWNLLLAQRDLESRRCFNGATAVMPWNQRSTRPRVRQSPTLQWGHGSDAVESRPRSMGHLSTSASFNGATAVMPWNHAHGEQH